MNSADDYTLTLGLAGTYWGERYPEFDVLLDGRLIMSDKIIAVPSQKGLPNPHPLPAEIEELTRQKYDIDVAIEPGDHVLSVVFKNKLPDDTSGFQPDGTWQNDKLIHIESVCFDGVDLDHLIFSESRYTWVDADGQTQTRDNCTTMAWNGSWDLKFSTPF